jgi:asparagine synthase (glutamine-hydrolysing)
VASRLCREAGLAPPHSFAIGLAGAPDPDAARRVAAFLGTEHHELTFTLAEALDMIPAAVRHLESYQQVRTAVPTMILARKVRETGVKMVLSGEGADELFGGYLYFHAAPSPDAFHAETVRKTVRLHQCDVMRANKAPMAYGLELRFPFLDRAFMDLVMGIDPADRMIRRNVPGRRGIEKEILRLAFDNPVAPWLPDDVLWRQKEQFSDGVGYAWVDTVRARAAARTVEADLLASPARFPEDPPVNPEMLWMRQLFEAEFVRGRASGRSALATIGTGRSIACSSPEAVAWDPAWAHLAGDISGRAIATVHAAGCALTR